MTKMASLLVLLLVSWRADAVVPISVPNKPDTLVDQTPLIRDEPSQVPRVYDEGKGTSDQGGNSDELDVDVKDWKTQLTCNDKAVKIFDQSRSLEQACAVCPSARICNDPNYGREKGKKRLPIVQQDVRVKNRPGPVTNEGGQSAPNKSVTSKPPSEQSGNERNTTPQNAGTASGNYSSDLNSCMSLARSAVNCCNNPASCSDVGNTKAASTSGMKDSCSAMRDSGLNDVSNNQSFVNACFSRYTTCVETCSSLAQSYAENSSTFTNAADSCARLSSKIYAVNDSSANSLSAASSGSQCSSASSAQPQNQSGSNNQQSKNDPYGCGQNPRSQSCQQCSANPNSAACQNALASQSKPAEQGQGSFGTPANQGHGSFNLADNGDAGTPQLGFGGQGANVPTYKTVANNSGGGIPGAGGGGQPASLGGSGKKGGGGPAASGSVTDIDEGMRSGGYSQPVGGGGGGSGVDTSGSEHFGARSPSSTGKLDLKAYLPGGARDPNVGRGAGGLRPPGTQIHGPHVIIWERITDCMRLKCKTGELYGCS